MTGIWSPIAIISDSMPNNRRIPGSLSFGRHSPILVPLEERERCSSFREIFYLTGESFVSAKILTHSANSLLRVINNDTYDELPMVFNRLAPVMFTKNKVTALLVRRSGESIHSFLVGIYLLCGESLSRSTDGWWTIPSSSPDLLHVSP